MNEIDLKKLEKARIVIKKDVMVSDDAGIWVTFGTIRRYMNYTDKSKHVFNIIKKNSVPKRKFQKKTLYNLNKYLNSINKIS